VTESSQQLITVFVPALNEEKNLVTAVEVIICGAQQAGNIPFEIIIVNDGSKDHTPNMADELAERYSFVKVIHNSSNEGLGSGFKKAIKFSQGDRITLFPADNCVAEETLVELLVNARKADFICAPPANSNERKAVRRILSILYSKIYIWTFRIPMSYIHATPVYSLELVRSFAIRSNKYGFLSEVAIKVLRKGASYLELTGIMNPQARNSSAIKIKNLVDVIVTYFTLIYEVYFRYRSEYRNLVFHKSRSKTD